MHSALLQILLTPLLVLPLEQNNEAGHVFVWITRDSDVTSEAIYVLAHKVGLFNIFKGYSFMQCRA